MDKSIILGLLQNIAMLLAFSMIYDHLWSRYEKPKNFFMKVLAGLILGVFGIILIMSPWRMVPGIAFDVRSVLLSISGLFLGVIPTITAMLIMGVYRLSQGGIGIWMGVAVILSSGAIGLLWNKLRPNWQSKNKTLELLYLGFAVHIVMLACTMLLPSEVIFTTVKTIILPIFTIYPLATMLLGLLMISWAINWQNRKELKFSEKKFRNIFENNQTAMVIIEPDTTISMVNNAFFELTGYSREEAVGMSWTKQIHPDDLERLKEYNRKRLINPKDAPDRYEFTFYTKNGSVKHGLTSVSVTQSNQKIILSFADITERINAEKALRESEEKYRILLDESTDPIFSFASDGTYMYVNKAFAKSLERNIDDIIGKKVWDIFSKEDADKRFAAVKHVFDSGEGKNIEVRVPLKNENHYYISTLTPITDKTGKVLSVICSSKNITERKLAEEKMRGSEARLTAFMKFVPALIQIKDHEFRTIYANDNLHHYFPVNEWMDKKPHELFSEEIANQIVEKDTEALEKGYIRYEETLIDRFDQQHIFETQKFKITVSETETLLGTIISDITERKHVNEKIKRLNDELENKVLERTEELIIKAVELSENEKALLNLVEDLNSKSEELKQSEIELQKANKELDSFAYSISHDLRAPLRAIDGFTKLLVENHSMQLDDDGKRICSVITESTIRMEQLIDDLLSFSRLGRSDLNCHELDLNQLIDRTYLEITTPIERERISINIAPLPKVFADYALMKQVLSNLLSNAIKFSSKVASPQIAINYQESDNDLTVSIKDNGVGFDMKYYSKLFGVFQRLHSLNEFEGTGVGLALSQRIIQRHKGKIWAEAEEDKGATFYFSLPKILVNE